MFLSLIQFSSTTQYFFPQVTEVHFFFLSGKNSLLVWINDSFSSLPLWWFIQFCQYLKRAIFGEDFVGKQFYVSLLHRMLKFSKKYWSVMPKKIITVFKSTYFIFLRNCIKIVHEFLFMEVWVCSRDNYVLLSVSKMS